MQGQGATCFWEPGYRPAPQRRFAEWALAAWLREIIESQGFRYCWSQEGSVKRIELLGPDSPGEYVYEIRPRDLRDAVVQDTARDIYWWVVTRGQIHHGKQPESLLR